jgi:hypothetical protein
MNRKLVDIARELTDTGAMPEGRRQRDRSVRVRLPRRLLPDDPHFCGPLGGVLQVHGLEALVHAEPAGAVVDEDRGRQQLGGTSSTSP